jgi:hypothetical protein
MMKTLLALITLLFASGIHAEVYKWVDEKGNVHYGDKPEPGSQTMDIQQQEPAEVPVMFEENQLSREEKRQRVSDALEEDRLAKNKERQEKKKERAQKKRECNRLKDRQRHVERATGLYKLDKEGNRVFMSNEQRKKSEQQLRKRIQKACS